MKNTSNTLNIFAYILFALMGSFFVSCEKMVLGEETSNDPENNFEIFWNDFDQHYGLFQTRGSDWDSIYQVYNPKVTATTTDAELWTYFEEMIEYLDDSHTYIGNPSKQEYYVSGFQRGLAALDEFSLDLLENKYVDNWKSISENIEFFYGSIKGKDIGYVYMGNMDDEDPAKIDQVLNDLKSHKALIFDIRNNGGGEDRFSARVAGSFADREELVFTAEAKDGPGADDFNEKTEFYSKVEVEEPYLKPVIILTDGYTISAAEIFLMYMNSFDHVTQLGDVTAGDFSDTSIERFLPNGWLYGYSTGKWLLPDGSSLDGIGHIPDVFVKNTVEDIAAENDKVMESAFEYLLDEYGIE